MIGLCSVLGLVGCSTSGTDAPEGSGALAEPGGPAAGTRDTDSEPTTLTVLAPASLTEAVAIAGQVDQVQEGSH